MMKSSGITSFIFFFLTYFLGAQEIPPIQNFTAADYGGGNQNWAISQSEDKLIYVANNDGLLEYNGARWKTYPSPNETVMRSVRVIGNKIYTGCYMEFGFWEKTELGELVYSSLSSQLSIELIEDEEFWNIMEIDGWVVFQSLKRIYIYNPSNSTLNQIDSEETIVKMFEVDDRIYFQRKGIGIYQIVNGKDVLLTNADIFQTDEVANIFSYGKELLILTRHNGFFTFNNQSLSKISSYIDRESDISIYNAIQLENGNYALGTISNGIVILLNDLKFHLSIDQGSGLANNTALCVFEDQDNNLWAGLDNGIGSVNIESTIRVYEDQKGVLGSVYASAVSNGNLYLGTNQGLFYKALNSQSDFTFIEGTQGQVWSLKVIDGQLFCGHHSGTYLINEGKIKKVAEIQGTWALDKLDNNRLIQGNYDGLYVIEKNGSNWRLKNKIDGFNNSARSFAIKEKEIFVNHEYKGLFKLDVDENFNRVVNIEVDTVLHGANSSVSKYNNAIYYSCKTGIYVYDESIKTFVRDSVFSTVYNEDEYVSGRFVINQEGDQCWIFSKEHISLVSAGNLAATPKIDQVPLTQIIRRNVIDYENIINTDGLSEYLLGTSFGYLVFNSDELQLNDFLVYINSISSGINADHSSSGKLVDFSSDGDFDSDENNFRINFHSPQYFKYFNPNYQFQLKGLYDQWSEWTSVPEVFYENLPPGRYTFNVRAKIGNKVSSNVASYEFYIAKPWYATNFMIVVYLLGVIVFSIFMHNVYRRYYRKKHQHLMDENRKELELTRLQNEREIIKLKNEQLEKDFKSKSNELAASTMSIIKKNELLTQIKEQLTHIEDKTAIKPVIKTIDKSLNHNENWEMFKEAFDNADAEFFKNLKALHPDLSPNDLKLCAYLRLNLSSKEVAQLINISPRSVEVKRYRLRKKLNLDSNENLSDYILSI